MDDEYEYESSNRVYYEEDGLYPADTIDPSPWALVVTLCFCVTLILLLPFGVAIQQCLYKRRKKQQQGAVQNAPKQSTQVPTDAAMDDFFANSTAPFFFVEDEEDDDEDDEDDDESLYGLGTEEEGDSKAPPSAGSDLWEDDLPVPAAHGYKRAKGIARLLKRGVPSSSQNPNSNNTLNNEKVAEPTNYLAMGDDVPTESPILQDDDEELLCYSDSDSEGGMDLLTQLVDEFDQLNGMEDEENEKTPIQAPLASTSKMEHQPRVVVESGTRQQPTAEAMVEKHTKYDIDLCCGRQPWYGYFFSSGFRRKLGKCSSWDDEMKKIVGLAVPYTLHATFTHIFELVEVVVIGQLISGSNSTLLGAYFAIDFVLSLSTMLLDGAINSLTVLCSHAVGAKNFELAGKYVQLALILYQVIFLPIVVVCWNRIDSVVLWLGFEEEEAAQAEAYGRIAFLAVAVDVFNTALHHMLDVTGFEWYSSVMVMTKALMNLVGVFAVSFFVNDTPLWMVGAVHLALSLVFSLLNGSIVIYKQWLLGFWNGFRSFALSDTRAVRTFFKTAGPLSLGYVVEYCEWEVLFVFAAAQGPAEVAVWGLMGYIWGFAEHVGEAIADAAEVRVAHLLGSQRPALARYSSHKSLLLGVMTSLLMTVVIMGLHNNIPAMLTKDETLQAMLSDLLPLVCVGLAALTFGSMSWTILCAQGRMRLATAITLLGSVCITLPLSVVSTFVLNFNLQGLLASLVIGYGLSGIVNSFIMVTSKWERISEKITRRNTEKKGSKPARKDAKPMLEMDYGQSFEVEVELSQIIPVAPDTLNTTADTLDDDDSSSSYDDYGWDELPNTVQEAAKVLGYSKRKWDHSIPTKFDNCGWTELTWEQQNAASILGYNEARWDNSLGDC